VAVKYPAISVLRQFHCVVENVRFGANVLRHRLPSARHTDGMLLGNLGSARPLADFNGVIGVKCHGDGPLLKDNHGENDEKDRMEWVSSIIHDNDSIVNHESDVSITHHNWLVLWNFGTGFLFFFPKKLGMS